MINERKPYFKCNNLTVAAMFMNASNECLPQEPWYFSINGSFRQAVTQSKCEQINTHVPTTSITGSHAGHRKIPNKFNYIVSSTITDQVACMSAKQIRHQPFLLISCAPMICSNTKKSGSTLQCCQKLAQRTLSTKSMEQG